MSSSQLQDTKSIHKNQFLYTCNKQSKNKIETILFTIASKTFFKYFGIYLTKE